MGSWGMQNPGWKGPILSADMCPTCSNMMSLAQVLLL